MVMPALRLRELVSHRLRFLALELASVQSPASTPPFHLEINSPKGERESETCLLVPQIEGDHGFTSLRPCHLIHDVVLPTGGVLRGRQCPVPLGVQAR